MLLPLRYPRVWISLGWFFVALALVVCLTPRGIPGTEGISDKMLHALGYLALTTWFTGIYPRSRYPFIAVALTGFGILIEVLQGTMNIGRVAEPRDVYADVVGIAIGIGLALALFGGWARRVETWFARRE